MAFFFLNFIFTEIKKPIKPIKPKDPNRLCKNCRSPMHKDDEITLQMCFHKICTKCIEVLFENDKFSCPIENENGKCDHIINVTYKTLKAFFCFFQINFFFF